MNIKKIIIWLIVAVGIGLGNFGFHHSFFVPDESVLSLKARAQPVINGEEYAQQLAENASNAAPDASTNKSLNDLASLLDIILNTLYIIIRPLLAITGMALDNSLVYGEAFGLTTTLRKFWTIMMQISFIVLTAMILWDIVKMIRKKDGDPYKDLPNKIKSWILAGVFIPLSWFIVSALIDLSTILIYQVGAIPLTLISSNDDTKILVNSSIINLADTSASTAQKQSTFRFNTTFSCAENPTKTYLPCKFEDNVINEDSWNQYIEQEKGKYTSTSTQGMAESIENGKWFCALSPTALMKVDYTTNISSRTGLTQLLQEGSVEMSDCSTIGDLINKSKSMVGPLYTVYGSLLNFTSLNVTVSGKSTETEVMLFLIKAITGILLIIPLITLAFVSIARIGILRMVIAFSPLLALNEVFKGKGISGDMSKKLESNWLDMVNFKTWVSDIINVIFQPVIVVLALWLSIVFLNATNNMLKYDSDKAGLLQAIGINIDSDDEYQIFSTVDDKGDKITDIKMKKFSAEYSTSIFFDYFSWIIANIFWIMIMRKLMFMALGASKMTQNITRKMESFGEDYLSSRPIFPGPNWALSRDSIKQITDMDRGVPGEIMKNITKDKTKDAAEELVSYTKARLPGSEEKGKHNKTFALSQSFDSPDTNKNQVAADTMANGIISLGAENRNFHYLNKEDVANWSKLTGDKAMNVTGDNLSEIVTQDNFWKAMAKSENSERVLKVLREAQTEDSIASRLVGPKNIVELRNNMSKGIQQIRTGGISSANNNNTIKSYDNEMVFYTTKADTTNNIYSLEQAFNVDKSNLNKNYQKINDFVKNEEVLHTHVKDYFGIKDLNTSNDWEVYSDGRIFRIKNPPRIPPLNITAPTGSTEEGDTEDEGN